MYIGLIGATGRLGTLTAEILDQDNASYVKISRAMLASVDNFRSLLSDLPSDLLLLDMSLPAGTLNLCNIINELDKNPLEKLCALVVGTTGHNMKEKEAIQKCSAKIPICMVSNFSKGIFLFEQLLKAKTSSGLSVSELARRLRFDLSIHEIHHTQKRDAPSGTAITLADASSVNHERISSSRVGKVVGEHSLILSHNSESLQITHTAHSRRLFAEGALELCKNIYKNRPKPGLLNTDDFFI